MLIQGSQRNILGLNYGFFKHIQSPVLTGWWCVFGSGGWNHQPAEMMHSTELLLSRQLPAMHLFLQFPPSLSLSVSHTHTPLPSNFPS